MPSATMGFLPLGEDTLCSCVESTEHELYQFDQIVLSFPFVLATLRLLTYTMCPLLSAICLCHYSHSVIFWARSYR